jgi:hypothetical protein
VKLSPVFKNKRVNTYYDYKNIVCRKIWRFFKIKIYAKMNIALVFKKNAEISETLTTGHVGN